jgi:hypothetical protein
VICSQNLPLGTKRLIDLLKNAISSGQFRVFSGALYSQSGLVPGSKDHDLTPEEVMEMNWLLENVVGQIPELSDLKEQAQPVLIQQGIKPSL